MPSAPNGQGDLWEMGADGSNPQRLTSNDFSSYSSLPALSLRGGFIAFQHFDPNGGVNIWRMDIDGGNLKQLTHGKGDFNPAVSPDGQWVVFPQHLGGTYTLMKIPSGGGPASQLTDYGSRWPTISPDGKWIACGYYPGQSQPNKLALVPFGGGQPVKLFPHPPLTGQGDVYLRFAPDGQALSFVNRVSGADNIWEQPLAGGPPKPVTHFTSERIFKFAWYRDGRLALARGEVPTDAVLIKNFQ